MGQGFHETAHNKTDLKKFGEGIERVFGKKDDGYCVCGFKPSFCECTLEEKPKRIPCDCDVYSSRYCSCGTNPDYAKPTSS